MIVLPLVASAQAAGQEKRKIEVPCGEYVVAITCGRDNTPRSEDARECNNNTLTFTGKNGKVVTPRTPKGFDTTKTPSGLSCGRAKDGRYYVIVEFLNGPVGCGPCTVFDLFEASGKRVTVNGKYLDKTIEKLGIPDSKQINIEEETK
jgi:hypothetical protein